MKTLKANLILSVLTIFVLMSCKDNSVSSDPIIEEKKEEITQITKELLPDNISLALINEADNMSDSDKIIYLDSVEVVVQSLRDSTSKYFGIDTFKKEIEKFQNEIAKQRSKNKDGMACSNDFKFGYARSGELNGEAGASAAIGALVAGLNMTSGGGIELIYDFVNMDRGIYHYSFCGVGGTLAGLGAGFSADIGFKGISKIITNIPYNKATINRFNGASKSKNYNVSLGLTAVLGFDLGLGVGKAQEIEGAKEQQGFFRNWSQCPANIDKPVNNRAPIEYSVSVSANFSKGAELIAAIESEKVASYREAVNNLYTNFDRDGLGGRKLAATKMALNLATAYPVKGISTAIPTPLDVTAAAMAIAYGFIDPQDCPEPAYFPALSTAEISNIQTNTFTATANIIDDGNDAIVDKGFCWSGENLPDIDDDCISLGSGSASYSGIIDDLIPGGTYQIRPYAVNVAGIGYGDEVSVKTELGKSGLISGEVLDALTRNPVSDVSISIFTEQDVKVGEILSAENGGYNIELPVGSGYRAKFQKSGYLSADYSNIDVREDEDYILSQLLYIDEQYAGEGNISGFIRNALNSEGVSGISLRLRRGINNLTGETVRETFTDNSGNYIFSNISAGYYTIQATGEGYNDTDFNVISIGGQTTGEQNAVISPLLDVSEIRIVLTWGEFPRDLDSHLTGPRNSGGRFHVFFYDSEYFEGDQLIANLDRDDTESFGPETITIYEQISGVYRYSVHDYSNLGSTASTALSNSGAQVRLYFGNQLIRTYNVPPNRGGTLWTVFELNDNQVTTLNRFSYEADPREVNSTANKTSFTVEQIKK